MNQMMRLPAFSAVPPRCCLVLSLLFVFFCGSPVCAAEAMSQSIHVEWGYTPPSKPKVVGYKLYQEGAFACQEMQPMARAMDCTVSLTAQSTDFTLTAVFNDGTESPRSAPFAYSKSPSIDTTGTAPKAVISTSAAAGTSPLSVSLDGSGSRTASKTAIVSYSWNFGDDSTGTGAKITHIFTSPGTYATSLTVVDSKGQRNTVSTPIVVTQPAPTAGKAVAAPSPASSPAGSPASSASSSNKNVAVKVAEKTPELNLEAGEVAVGSDWAHVSFASRYRNPIVIAGPPRFNNSDPCVVRIRNVNATGFDIRLAEWQYQDGKHPRETISYLALEKGRMQLSDSSQLEAGSFTGTTTVRSVPFATAFKSIPVVLTNVTSMNETDTIAGRVQAIGRGGFAYSFREQEKHPLDSHGNETIHYIAWEPGKGTIGPLQFESATTAQSINSSWSMSRFQSAFAQPPMVLAEMQTMINTDTAALRLQQVSASGFQVKVEEEQSKDKEVIHPAERIGYLAFSQIGDQRLAVFSWEFDQDQEAGISGFRILRNGQPICATGNETARRLACTIDAPLRDTAFAVQAVAADGENARAPSNTIMYRP